MGYLHIFMDLFRSYLHFRNIRYNNLDNLIIGINYSINSNHFLLQVRNCSSFIAYHLVPTPGCNMGYCVGEGVPCPPGLASDNGYTPCDCEYFINLFLASLNFFLR